uniref:Uncharacterized protein n=1 Tax=Rhizophora mucronata TaxID=61149 RepID=A0A2P2QRR0_RHIMU
MSSIGRMKKKKIILYAM